MDSFIDSLPDLTQTQVWILAAVLAGIAVSQSPTAGR